MPAKVRRYQIPPEVIEAEDLVEKTIQIAVPVVLLGKSVSVAIDSTGVKDASGHFTLTSEMIKHLKEAYLEAQADTPSATDAAVDVELYNETDGAVVAKVTFSGAGGHLKSGDIASSLKDLAGKVLSGRINVTTASATSGATQVFRSIVLLLVLGVS